MIDAGRLSDDERALYERLFPNGIKPGVKAEGARVSSRDAEWVFAAICFRTLGSMPSAVIEHLEHVGYEPVIEFMLYAREVHRLRTERGARRRRVWRLMVLMMIRRAELRAQRERIVSMLVAEGERARSARRLRWPLPRGIMRATVSGWQIATLLGKLIVALVLAVLIYFVGLIVVMMAGGTECGDCPWWGDLFKWPAALAVIAVSFVIVFALLSGAIRDATTARHK